MHCSLYSPSAEIIFYPFEGHLFALHLAYGGQFMSNPRFTLPFSVCQISNTHLLVYLLYGIMGLQPLQFAVQP